MYQFQAELFARSGLSCSPVAQHFHGKAPKRP